MSELKPCPFCGKVDELYSIPRFLEITKGETKEIEWAVGCKRCDVHLYRARYAKDEGIATWNTRPIEDALRAEIARRDEEVAELRKQKYIPVHDTLTDAGKEYYEKCIRQEKELARRDEQIETLEDKLHKIADWCKAYPLEFADEPTSQEWEAAHKTMSENGFSLTCFVISGMRKVTTGIAEIANLREGEK